jgi:AcrR family transcriptional regulator
MADPAPVTKPGGQQDGEPLVSRAPWGSISRDDIVYAAVRVVAAGGYQQMSIRSLAADLGVAPMSLYRHIRDKDDLLDEVVDRLLAQIWRPAVGADDWQVWVIEAAANLWRFLSASPLRSTSTSGIPSSRLRRSIAWTP